MNQFIAKLTAIAIGATVFASAQATPLTGNVTAAYSQSVITKTNFDRASKNLSVQVWSIADTGVLALCIDPVTALNANATYNTTGTDFTGFDGNTTIERLYSLYYADVLSTDAAVAKVAGLGFQLALWELYSDKTGTYGDLTSGSLSTNYTATGALSTGKTGKEVIDAANLMIAGAKGDAAITTYYDFTKYSYDGSQSIVSATAIAAVPEPTTWAMMGLGLGVMGLVARRRKA